MVFQSLRLAWRSALGFAWVRSNYPLSVNPCESGRATSGRELPLGALVYGKRGRMLQRLVCALHLNTQCGA